MPRYIVEVPAVYTRQCIVHAASVEEARILAEGGEGSWGAPEYSHEIDRDTLSWRVQEDTAFDDQVQAMIDQAKVSANALEALAGQVPEQFSLLLLREAGRLRNQAVDLRQSMMHDK